MRHPLSLIVCILTAGFCVGLNAQIPERAQFQPGTYAVPYRPLQQPVVTYNKSILEQYTLLAAADADNADGEDVDDERTDWEKEFSPQVAEPMAVLPLPPPQPYEVPHLTFVYNHWTGRFHIAPYEPGYAANPAAFPVQTSPLHIWTSSKSSSAQLPSQVPYMSYYDPDPVILPAEIRLRGAKLFVPFTEMQPMPLPVPRPATAQPLYPSRTRLGERMRQTFGTFIVR